MIQSPSRRQFLHFMGQSSLALSVGPAASSLLLSSCASSPSVKGLKGLPPTLEDGLNLIDGLNYQVLCRWGDVINKSGETFGFNNDFTCFLPLDSSGGEGLLWVNHESVIPQLVHNKSKAELRRNRAEIMLEQELVGGSILHLKKEKGMWQRLLDSSFNRRLHGRTPIPFSHGKTIQGSRSALGTIANCAGGLTPWNTFLTSEENYDDFYGEAYWVNGKREVRYIDKFNWYKQFPLPPEHYGWITEIDPKTGRAEKQVLLGRAPHEGATLVTTKSKKLVVYMGEDRPGGFIYKFVGPEGNFKVGTLYAADTLRGRWLPLDIKQSKALSSTFPDQLQVLTYAHQSAALIGATPQDRPEDIKVHPQTGAVFIALTNNPATNNPYGSLLKIQEGGDHDALEFQASTWLSAGPDAGLACPDNLCFDRKGNLWVTVDVSEKSIGKPPYEAFGNNGLYYVPMQGPQAGQPIRVASAPVDAELTGPWFSPDFRTLFLAVQHPGSQTKDNLAKPTSTWPDGPGKMPRSAVVAIQGPLFEKLI